MTSSNRWLLDIVSMVLCTHVSMSSCMLEHQWATQREEVSARRMDEVISISTNHKTLRIVSMLQCILSSMLGHEEREPRLEHQWSTRPAACPKPKGSDGDSADQGKYQA